MNTFQQDFQTPADSHSADAPAHPHQAPADRYGMSEAQYKVYLQDCEESAMINEDILYFLTNDADAAAYLF